MKILQKALALFLSCLVLWISDVPVYALAGDQSAAQTAPPQVEKQTPEELQQLVAPIALYPDALVSQIFAGATYPTEIVEADRWMQAHPNLNGKDLASAVDEQSWDPSIKALTQFPSVLANMDKNLSWTSALGEAYINQQEAVMDAVQVMRARAKSAGNLKSNDQVKVVTERQTIIVEPAEPEVVYVPAYDPWIVYGAPVVVWPGWYPYPGLYVAGPGVSFGVGFAVGLFAGVAWGSHGWGCDWGHRTVVFNHNTFISNSKTFYGGRKGFHDFGAARGYEGFHNSGAGRGYEGSYGPGVGAGMKDPAAETFVATEFTAARPSVGLQSRTPKLVRILAPSVGMTTVEPRAAIRTEATRACTAAAFTKVVFTEVASAAAVD